MWSHCVQPRVVAVRAALVLHSVKLAIWAVGKQLTLRWTEVSHGALGHQY